MNILNHIDPVITTLTLPWPAETLFIPVTIKPGYLGKLCKLMADIKLETENPAYMGGYVGLDKSDYTALINVNTLSGWCSSGSWSFWGSGTITPGFYEPGLQLRIAIGDSNYQPCIVTHLNIKLTVPGGIQYLPLVGIG